MRKAAAAFAFLLWAAPASAQTIRYSVAMPQPSSHEFQVEMTIDNPGSPSIDLDLPAWNGLYQIRDFSQFVRNFRANVPFKRVDKDSWRLTPGTAEQVTISYGYFADEWSAFSSQLNATHAFFNSADLLLLWPAKRSLPVEFSIVPPAGWQVATSLPPGGKPFSYRADNYDHLVDCPVDVGKLDTFSFAVDGVPFNISVDGDHRDYDRTELQTLVEQIVRTETGFMQDIPMKHYNFIFHFSDSNRDGNGGMEHRDSAAIHIRMSSGTRSVRDVAGVTAHEFFHLWNVKRIRPQGLEPIDYSKENYTSALWFSEGVTSYYGDLLLKRGGIWNRQQYLNSLTDEIRMLQGRPAHKTQSAAESSLTTWFDKYESYGRPDRSISYYNKGLLIGLLLDFKIRDATDNKSSLDNVVHYLNESYAKKNRFFEDDYGIAKAITEATGVNLNQDYEAYVHGTEELPYNDVLRAAGLEWNGDRVRELPNPTPRQKRILESWLSGGF